MEYVILITIGFVMGLLGGMVGIGGSVVMIPALTIAFGENQHLYQASAMICNFFVAASSLLAHRKARALVPAVLKRLIPLAVVGIITGVWLSNTSVFAGPNSYILARAFGAFMIYVVAYYTWRFFAKTEFSAESLRHNIQNGPAGIISAVVGAVTGICAGLFGMGAGSVATPLQQLTLKMPIKNAMSNSAATITAIALIGAAYKNYTLPRHDIAVTESLKIAACIIPTAIAGGFAGGHLMHKLPQNLVRTIFIIILVLAAFKLLTTQPG